MTEIEPPSLTFDANDHSTIIASGTWQVQPLAHPQAIGQIEKALRDLRDPGSLQWDLTRIKALDHIGAQVLWNAWKGRLPAKVELTEQHAAFFARLETAASPLPAKRPARGAIVHAKLSAAVHTLHQHGSGRS